MNTKLVLGGLAAVIIVLGAFYFMKGDTDSVPTDVTAGAESPISAMRVAGNAIVVMPQKAGNDISVSQAYLTDAGFIVIHEDTNGSVGRKLGSSGLLQPGEQSSMRIALSRATKSGEKLHATMMADTDASGTLTDADQPMQSGLGGAIDAWFDIDNEAVEGAITI